MRSEEEEEVEFGLICMSVFLWYVTLLILELGEWEVCHLVYDGFIKVQFLFGSVFGNGHDLYLVVHLSYILEE